MAWSRMRHLALLLVVGCGLTLDLSPPDPVRVDGGRRVDGGVLDGGRTDAGDGGTIECRSDAECDDGNACTGLELCVEGTCSLGTPVVCPDEDVCDGSFACDPATGECTTEVEPPVCEGGDACTGIQTCDPVAGCITSPGLRCDDGIDCTEDLCVDGGCVYEPRNDRCVVDEGGQCSAEGCIYPTCDEATCVADNPCVVAECVEGVCVREPIRCDADEECCGGECEPIGCDDGNGCTRDFCAPRSGCQHEPAATAIACDDGNLCTVGDRCDGATCTPGGPRCTSTNVCLAPTCDPISGLCGTSPADGAMCNDGNPCTRNDRCSGGVCRAGDPTPCDDGNPCTADACGMGGCVNSNVADDTSCRDASGNAGACFGGRCLVITACAVGFSDCDGDGVCECRGDCAINMAAHRVCTVSACEPCGADQICCNLVESREYGVCYGRDTECLGGACCTLTDL